MASAARPAPSMSCASIARELPERFLSARFGLGVRGGSLQPFARIVDSTEPLVALADRELFFRLWHIVFVIVRAAFDLVDLPSAGCGDIVLFFFLLARQQRLGARFGRPRLRSSSSRRVGRRLGRQGFVQRHRFRLIGG